VLLGEQLKRTPSDICAVQVRHQAWVYRHSTGATVVQAHRSTDHSRITCVETVLAKSRYACGTLQAWLRHIGDFLCLATRGQRDRAHLGPSSYPWWQCDVQRTAQAL
jgi:hypothetical protein